MERVVLDTNVLIDGAKDELSASATIVRDVIGGRIEALVSRPLRDEYLSILHRNVRDEAYQRWIHDFLEAVQRLPRIDIPHVVTEDAEDDKVLATAVEGHATTLITSDQHLLSLDPYEGIRILTPQAFVNRRNGEESSWSSFARSLGIG